MSTDNSPEAMVRPVETEVPSDLTYFGGHVALHGCSPDESGRCAVAACICKCHQRPAGMEGK